MRLRKLAVLFLSWLLAGASAANSSSSVATSTVTLADIKSIVDGIAADVATLKARGGMAVIQVVSDPNSPAGNIYFYNLKEFILLGNAIPGAFRDSAGNPHPLGYKYTDTQLHRLPQGRYLMEVLQPPPPAADAVCALSPSVTIANVTGSDTGGRRSNCNVARIIKTHGPSTPGRKLLFNGAAIFDFDGVDDTFTVRFKLSPSWLGTAGGTAIGDVPSVWATIKITKIE